MTKPELMEQKPITMVELKEELEAIKKREKEMGVIASKTEEYLAQFALLSPKKAEELSEKLKSLKISRLKEEIIIKIADILPTSADELKTILQGYVVNINQADMNKIIEVVNGFAPAKK